MILIKDLASLINPIFLWNKLHEISSINYLVTIIFSF